MEKAAAMGSLVKQVHHKRKDNEVTPNHYDSEDLSVNECQEISEEDQLNMQSKRMEEQVPSITVQEMVVTNPDFLGKCFYFNKRIDQVGLTNFLEDELMSFDDTKASDTPLDRVERTYGYKPV
jgi:hypothetical protein